MFQKIRPGVIALCGLFAAVGVSASAQGDQRFDISGAFQEYCIDTRLNAQAFSELVEERKLETAPRERVTQYMQGILPYHINAYRLSDQAYLIWSLQGNVTGEQMRLNRSGVQVSSDPVEPDRLMSALLVLGGPELIGSKQCQVMSFENVSAARFDFQPLLFNEESSGDLSYWGHLVRNFPALTTEGLIMQWMYGSEVSVSYFHAYDSSFVVLKAGASIPPGTESSSYLLQD